MTGAFLFVAILFEWFGQFVVYENLMTGSQLIWGTVVKSYLVIQFSVAYWYTRPKTV